MAKCNYVMDIKFKWWAKPLVIYLMVKCGFSIKRCMTFSKPYAVDLK